MKRRSGGWLYSEAGVSSSSSRGSGQVRSIVDLVVEIIKR